MLKLRGVGVVGILAGLAAFGARSAVAQSVTITPITMTNNNEFNLTTLGPSGWIKWGSTSPNSGNYLSTSGQSFTTTVFGPGTNNFDNTFIGNNNVTFTWTNGTQGNNSQIAGVLFRDPGPAGDSTGSGFTVSVPTVGPTGTLQFYVYNLGDAASLNAKLQGTSGTLSSKTDTSFNNTASLLTGAPETAVITR